MPKDQRSILELPTAFSRRPFHVGETRFLRSSGLRDEGVGFRESGLRTLAALRLFLSRGEARVEECRFRNLPGRVVELSGALVLEIGLAPGSKTEPWCLLFKLRVGLQRLSPCGIQRRRSPFSEEG